MMISSALILIICCSVLVPTAFGEPPSSLLSLKTFYPRGSTRTKPHSLLLLRGGEFKSEEVDVKPVVAVASLVHFVYGFCALLAPNKVTKVLFDKEVDDNITQTSVRQAGIFSIALGLIGLQDKDEYTEKALNTYALSFLASAVAGWKFISDEIVTDKIVAGVNTVLGLFCAALAIVKRDKIE